jgi:hypothetical protein
MPALSEREPQVSADRRMPKVRLWRRFSKNKKGRGTLFYFCGSLFLSCRLAAPACRQAGMCPGRRPGEEKGKNPLAFPGFPNDMSGKVRTFSQLFTADTLSDRRRRAGSGVQTARREDDYSVRTKRGLLAGWLDACLPLARRGGAGRERLWSSPLTTPACRFTCRRHGRQGREEESASGGFAPLRRMGCRHSAIK